MMRNSPTDLVNLGFGGLMVLITFTGAIVFFFTDLMQERVYGNNRYILGAVFLFYCVYRSYRLYNMYQAKKRREREI